MEKALVRIFTPSVRAALDFLFVLFFYLPILVILTVAAAVASLVRKPIDVGLGPEPLINNVYHKKALLKAGFSAETFVNQTYYITQEFDFALSPYWSVFRLKSYFLFLRAIFRFRVLYIYFNGGPLSWTYHSIFEGWLYRLAGVKVVVMPYGADVHELSRTSNLKLRHAMSVDYPLFQRQKRKRISRQIDHWVKWADHIIAGCDWVEYLPCWDTLTTAHFSVDTERLKPSVQGRRPGPVRILHAPNHKEIKGSRYFSAAVEELRREGLDVELVVVSGVNNQRLIEMIDDCDIVADQLVIGWHGIFAVEAMACGKPVLCYLREDFLELFRFGGALESDECVPLVSCTTENVKAKIRELVLDAELRARLGRQGVEYVKRHHSLEAVGALFKQINESLGLSRVGVTRGVEQLAQYAP